MLTKVAGLARALAIILGIVAGFVALPVNVALVLVLLGIIAGFAYGADDFVRLVLLAIALPIVGMALTNIPAIGDQLSAAMNNVALAVGGVLATRVILRMYDVVVGDLKGLAG